MSDDVTEHEFPEEPVIGDGILTLPPSEGKKKMPVDLPESVAVNLLAEATNNMQTISDSQLGCLGCVCFFLPS